MVLSPPALPFYRGRDGLAMNRAAWLVHWLSLLKIVVVNHRLDPHSKICLEIMCRKKTLGKFQPCVFCEAPWCPPPGRLQAGPTRIAWNLFPGRAQACEANLAQLEMCRFLMRLVAFASVWGVRSKVQVLLSGTSMQRSCRTWFNDSAEDQSPQVPEHKKDSQIRKAERTSHIDAAQCQNKCRLPLNFNVITFQVKQQKPKNKHTANLWLEIRASSPPPVTCEILWDLCDSKGWICCFGSNAWHKQMQNYPFHALANEAGSASKSQAIGQPHNKDSASVLWFTRSDIYCSKG